MHSWITDDIKKKIRSVFEPRYNRKLTDEDVSEIAMNLSDFLEVYLKLKWKEKYEKQNKAA